MTTHRSHDNRPTRQGIAASATFAAGALLFVTALLTLFQGVSALSSAAFIVKQDYAAELNTTGWGLIHIAGGILLGGVAIGLILGARWARVTAIVMASLSIVAMFLWLPYYPMWSLVVIALDIVVVWAVTTWEPR